MCAAGQPIRSEHRVLVSLDRGRFKRIDLFHKNTIQENPGELSLRQPIQLTEVPVNVNMTRAPAAADVEAAPSLQVLFTLPCNQAPL
jgi:hypothetical protein